MAMRATFDRSVCSDRECDASPMPGWMVLYIDVWGEREGDIATQVHFYCQEHLDRTLNPGYQERLWEVNPRLEVVVLGPEKRG